MKFMKMSENSIKMAFLIVSRGHSHHAQRTIFHRENKMSTRGIYEEGDEVDFDHINEQSLKNIPRYELVRDSNADIDITKISAEKAFEIYSDVNRKLEPARETRDITIEETPRDKFNRIHNEFQELRQELDSIAKQDESEREREGNYLPLLLREIESLQEELLKMDATEDFKRILDTETAETLNTDEHIIALRQNLDYQKAETLLARLKDIEKQGGALDGKNISYKIGLDNAPEKVRQQLKLSDLQRRITNLEKVLGTTGSGDILESLKKVEKMTELLSESSLDSVMGRVAYISQQLSRMEGKKATLNLDEYKLAKAESLYEAYAPLEKTVEQVPQIVNRLESLKVIHEESAKITNKVNRLRDNQNAVLQNLEDNKVLLQKMEETFGKNLTTISENIKSLQDRMAKLGK